MSELTPKEVEQAGQRAVKEGYFHRILVGFDQFANILTGGLPDETISARSQRAAHRGSGFGKFMAWWLGKIQRHHGALAEAGDEARAERIEQTEEKDLGLDSQTKRQ